MRPLFPSLLALPFVLCAPLGCAQSGPAKAPVQVATPTSDASSSTPAGAGSAPAATGSPVALTPPNAPVGDPVRLEKPPEPPSPERNYPAILSFGFGGVAALVGAIGGGLAFAKFDEVTKACGGTHCPESMRGEVEAGQTMAGVSTAGFVFAGLGVAQGIFFWVVPRGELPRRTSVVVSPSFVGVKGAF